MIATCNMCKEKDSEAEPFSVPWDPIGQELMKQHLQGEHGIGSF